MQSKENFLCAIHEKMDHFKTTLLQLQMKKKMVLGLTLEKKNTYFQLVFPTKLWSQVTIVTKTPLITLDKLHVILVANNKRH